METDKPMPNAEAKISLRCRKNRRPDHNDVIESKIKLFSAQKYLADAEGRQLFFFLYFIYKRLGDQMVSPFEALP